MKPEKPKKLGFKKIYLNLDKIRASKSFRMCLYDAHIPSFRSGTVGR